MKKRHLTISVLLHAGIIFALVFMSGAFMSGNQSNSSNALMVSISGNPELVIGSGAGIKKDSILGKQKIESIGFESTTVIEHTTSLSGEGGGTGKGATSYTGSILQKIQEYKYYPVSAKKNKLTGSVKINFTISNNGKILEDPKILNSSGHEILDDTAIKIIKNSAPFPVFPQNIKEKELSLNVSIDFTL
jgi:TonB family protein